MYMVWCLNFYYNPIYCWTLSIYNYFNLIPMSLYYSNTCDTKGYFMIDSFMLFERLLWTINLAANNGITNEVYFCMIRNYCIT